MPLTRVPGAGAALAGLLGAGLCLAAGLSAQGCSGGGGGGAPALVVPATVAPLTSAADASRFLIQASFGPSPADVDHLKAVGYDYWIEEQALLPATLHLPVVDGHGLGPSPSTATRVNAWFWAAMRAPDQLRQRVAWALSQILVVSEVDIAGSDNTRPLANYYDILVRNALGNYRDLLEEVTLSPVMGVYLSMVRNEKADPARNVRPDENYAREIMQLFSIGLVRLNDDGTAPVGSGGLPIPTYDQEVIEGFAQVFTGWTYAGATSWRNPGRNMFDPMIPFEDYHEQAEKRVLDGRVIPAGGTARQDLEAALDIIFNHPNVGPFVCRQLIQRLVTSNPTQGYVARVTAVFNNNGKGVRGDLKAVVKAILLDREARQGHVDSSLSPRFGMLREPLLRQTALWRAFNAFAANGLFVYGTPERDLAQGPLRSPSVFNFYRPDYRQPGEITTSNLDSPEFQILTESAITTTTNRLFASSFDRWYGRPQNDFDDVQIYLEEEKALARTSVTALIDRLDLLLLGGRMSPELRAVATALALDTPLSDDGTQRVLEAVFIVVSSPEFAVQR